MRTTQRIVISAGLALALCACGVSDSERGAPGNLNLSLTLPSGLEITEVSYEIVGGPSVPFSGSFDVASEDGVQTSLSVPAGLGYSITLTAFSVSRARACSGSAPFDVAASQTTVVSVTLSCRNVRDVTVEGEFNLCPEVSLVTSSAPDASVGESIALAAAASDSEDDLLSFAWTGTGGSFSEPTSATTDYTCLNAGTHTIAVVVSDDSFDECSEATLLTVTCDEPPPPPDPPSAWNEPVLLDVPLAGDAKFPQVAVDESGNATVVWSQGFANDPRVWARRFDALTETWGTPVDLSPLESGGGEVPQVVVDSIGVVTVVWVQSTAGFDSIWFNRFTPGVGWGTAGPIENDESGDARQPALTIDGAGIVTAVWSQNDGTAFNIVANQLNGSSWGTPVLLETVAGNASVPQAAADADGNLNVVWEQVENSSPRVLTVRFEAATWSAPIQLQTIAGSAFAPQLDVDANGNVMAVWLQFDGVRYNVWARRFTPGVGWGSPQVIDGEDTLALGPQVAVDPDGNATVVWYQDGANGLENVYANRFVPGVGWGASAINIEQAGAGGAIKPAVTVDPDGNATAIWEQSDATRNNIWSNRFSFDADSWGTFEILETDNVGGARDPQVTADRFGRVTAVWSQLEVSGQFNIYAARFE